MPSGPRKTASDLSESVRQQLHMYAIAASAAGVGVLALAQPVEAKIVYTPANVVIGYNGVETYYLDLNHGGITDFTIHWAKSIGIYFRHQDLYALPAASNQVVGMKSCSSGFCTINAAALYRGVKIGSGQAFYGGKRASMARGQCKRDCSFWGNWLGANNRYLGLAFTIHGKTHYGWARLTVRVVSHRFLSSTLTGYAYETIPGKSIIAGRTKAAEDDPTNGRDSANPNNPGSGASLTNPIPDTPQPASLGMLALGAQGAPLWRRRESAIERNLKGALL
jgi:hypothetical protein